MHNKLPYVRARQLLKSRPDPRRLIGGRLYRKTKLTKQEFITGLIGTCGVVSHIARNIGVTSGTIQRHLEQPGWEDIRAMFLEERRNYLGTAEEALLHCARQRYDLPTTLRAAQLILSKLRPKRWGDQPTKINLDAKVQTRNTNLNVDIASLDLPVEVLRSVLAAQDKREKAEQDAEMAAAIQPRQLGVA